MEDIQPIVIDNGSGTMKVGFAGDDAPRAVFAPVIGRPHLAARDARDCYVGDAAQAKRDILALSYPIQRGLVTDWDGMEKIWHHSFVDQLHVPPERQPVLLTERTGDPKPQREKTTQIMFETFSTPAMYLANHALLAYSASVRGRTGMVLDSGEGVTQAVPLYDGHPLPHATLRMDWGGRDLTDYMARLLAEDTRSYQTSAEWSGSIGAIKEKYGYVSLDYERDVATAASSTELEKSYELPSGQVVNVGNARFRCPEALFQPSFMGIESMGIHELIHKSIQKCPAEIQKELYYMIVLVGGSTLFPDLSDRLKNELKLLAPENTRVYVIASPERKYSAWIGGSIIASMSYYEDMWITRHEYDECGPAIVHRKCF